MTERQIRSKQFMVSILSLSLLTVMAGAAVAPALGVIRSYFADSHPLLVQMIISVPAICPIASPLCWPFCSVSGQRWCRTVKSVEQY